MTAKQQFEEILRTYEEAKRAYDKANRQWCAQQEPKPVTKEEFEVLDRRYALEHIDEVTALEALVTEVDVPGPSSSAYDRGTRGHGCSASSRRRPRCAPGSSEVTPMLCDLSGERWTLHICEDCRQLAHGPGSRCAKDRRRTWTKMTTVEVVPASDLEAALDALKTADSWLWNKVVTGCYGPPGPTEPPTREELFTDG